jgi:hypothetical protein
VCGEGCLEVASRQSLETVPYDIDVAHRWTDDFATIMSLYRP